MSRGKGSFIAVLTAAIALLPASISAQQDARRTPTAVVLKRIAEALEGYPSAGTVYVVLDSAQEVAALLPSRAEADSVRLRLTGEIHGPFSAVAPPDRIRGGCVHTRGSAYEAICPEIPVRDIRTMSLVIGMRDGTSRPIQLPMDTDAIFLTLSAFDKFVFPYYARINGVEAAAAMRRRMLAGDRPR